MVQIQHEEAMWDGVDLALAGVHPFDTGAFMALQILFVANAETHDPTRYRLHASAM